MIVQVFALQRQGLVTGRSSCQNMGDGSLLLDAAASTVMFFASR